MPKKRPNSTAAKNRRQIRKSTSAKAQQKQIMSTQNQVSSIRRHLNLTKQRVRWHCGFSEKAINAYLLIIPLTSGPSNVSPAVTNTTPPVSCVWGTTMTTAPQDDALRRSKVVVNTQWVDLAIHGGTEPSILYQTAFLVQLQDNNASQVYEETAGMTTLTRGVDYVTPLNGLVDSGYGPYINNSRFKIIKRLEFSTTGPVLGYPGGPPGEVGSGMGAAMRRTQFKINYGNTVFKSTGDGATSTTLQYSDIDPKHKRFIVLFNDNNLLDGEYPNVIMSSLITGYAAE